MKELNEMTIEELQKLIQDAQAMISSKQVKKEVIAELAYNQYKGTGKCWIAKIDPSTKKILSFLDTESVQKRDSYSGHKTFVVPLIEGAAYAFNEAGSKSNDSRHYFKVSDGKLVQF